MGRFGKYLNDLKAPIIRDLGGVTKKDAAGSALWAGLSSGLSASSAVSAGLGSKALLPVLGGPLALTAPLGMAGVYYGGKLARKGVAKLKSIAQGKVNARELANMTPAQKHYELLKKHKGKAALGAIAGAGATGALAYKGLTGTEKKKEDEKKMQDKTAELRKAYAAEIIKTAGGNISMARRMIGTDPADVVKGLDGAMYSKATMPTEWSVNLGTRKVTPIDIPPGNAGMTIKMGPTEIKPFEPLELDSGTFMKSLKSELPSGYLDTAFNNTADQAPGLGDYAGQALDYIGQHGLAAGAGLAGAGLLGLGARRLLKRASAFDQGFESRMNQLLGR